MTTATQLNWHNKYQSTVAELHDMRQQLDQANLECYKLKQAMHDLVEFKRKILEAMK